VGIEDNVCAGKRAGYGAVSPRRFGLIKELCVFDPRHISFGVEFNAGDPENRHWICLYAFEPSCGSASL